MDANAARGVATWTGLTDAGEGVDGIVDVDMLGVIDGLDGGCLIGQTLVFRGSQDEAAEHLPLGVEVFANGGGGLGVLSHQVVVGRAVADAAAAETCRLATIDEVDATLTVAHHEVIHEATIGFPGEGGIVGIEQSEAHALQIGGGEDGRTRRFQIVGNGRRGVSVGAVVALGHIGAVVVQQLIPAAAVGILLGGDARSQLLQTVVERLIVFCIGQSCHLHLFQHVDKCQQIPGFCPTPVFGGMVHLFPFLGRDARPAHGSPAARIGREGVIEQSHVGVPQVSPRDGELSGDQVPVVGGDGGIVRVFVDHLCQQGWPHVLSVAPHLVGVGGLVPPATSRISQCAGFDDVVSVGLLNAFQRAGETFLCGGDGGGVGVRRTVGKTPAGSQLLQLEIELHGVEVIEAHALFSRITDVEGVAIVLDSIVPGAHIHLGAVLIVVDGLDDGLCHQSRHVVEVALRVVGLSKELPMSVEHTKPSILRIGLEVVDARVDDQLRVTHALVECAGVTSSSRLTPAFCAHA